MNKAGFIHFFLAKNTAASVMMRVIPIFSNNFSCALSSRFSSPMKKGERLGAAFLGQNFTDDFRAGDNLTSFTIPLLPLH